MNKTELKTGKFKPKKVICEGCNKLTPKDKMKQQLNDYLCPTCMQELNDIPNYDWQADC